MRKKKDNQIQYVKGDPAVEAGMFNDMMGNGSMAEEVEDRYVDLSMLSDYDIKNAIKTSTNQTTPLEDKKSFNFANTIDRKAKIIKETDDAYILQVKYKRWNKEKTGKDEFSVLAWFPKNWPYRKVTLKPMQEKIKEGYQDRTTIGKREPIIVLNSKDDKSIKEQIKSKSRGVRLSEETHRITPTKELQDLFEDRMEEIGFVLDDVTTRNGISKQEYTSFLDDNDEAKSIHYQFISTKALTDQEIDDLMTKVFDLTDELEDDYGTRILLSAGQIISGEFEGYQTIGMDMKPMLYADDGEQSPSYAGNKLRLSKGKPIRQQDKDLVNDIKNHINGIDIDNAISSFVNGGNKKNENLKEGKIPASVRRLIDIINGHRNQCEVKDGKLIVRNSDSRVGNTTFPITKEQERKLKKLGYLNENLKEDINIDDKKYKYYVGGMKIYASRNSIYDLDKLADEIRNDDSLTQEEKDKLCHEVSCYKSEVHSGRYNESLNEEKQETFTSKEANELSKEFQNYLYDLDTPKYYDVRTEKVNDGEYIIRVNIEYGDLVHDHKYLDDVAKEFFNNKGIDIMIYEPSELKSKIDEDNIYSSSHIIQKSGNKIYQVKKDDDFLEKEE